jgi:hypothetical protein
MLSQEKTSASPREFWAGEELNFLCWCAGCGLMCTVVVSSRLVSHEPEH